MNKINLKTLMERPKRISFSQIVLVLLLACGIFKGEIHAQTQLEKRISITANNMEMQEFLDRVQKQATVKFSYSPSVIDPHAKVSYTGKNVALKTVLEAVLSPLKIQYKYIENKIVLYPETKQNEDNAVNAPVQGDRIIKGLVTDSAGKPLTGAYISVEGKTTGVYTKEDGSFSIKVLEGTTSVIVSYVGYLTQTVALDSDNLSVVLQQPAVNANDAVVVTALGISKQQKALGYSTTTVNSSLFNQAKEPNIANSLTGRVAGLNINSVSSGPGSSARILLRGVSNFSGTTTPLVVIDGVPMDNRQNGSAGVYGGADMGDGISSLNPDDIESITVLKGSTSSALYGTRASNGVILVTTKSGKGANRFAVEYATNFSLNQVINYEDYQKVYGQGTGSTRPQNITDNITSGIESWGEKLDGAPTMGIDGNMHPYSAVSGQLGKFYRTAPVWINTVSVVNGGKNGNMRLSLSNTNNQSVIPNSNLKRYSANLNITQNVTEKFKVTAMVNYLNENVKNRPYLNDKSRNPNWTMFLLPANIDPNILKPGYVAGNTITGETELALSSDGYTTNPWFATSQNINNTTRNRFTSSTLARYDFTKSLYAQGRVGLDYVNDEVLNIEPVGIGYKQQGALQEQSTSKTTELNMDGLLGYNKKINSDFSINAVAGMSQRQYNFKKIGYVNGANWLSLPYTPGNLGVAAQPMTLSNSSGLVSKIKTNSLYYSADFGYKDFLTLSTTGRWDWYSEALPKNLPLFAPSVSGSFLFGNLINIPQLSFGKLRATYAETGGEPNPFQTQVYYLPQSTNQNIPYGTTNSQATILDIAPFKMREFEVGIETKWLNGRIGMNATYFSKKTKNELIAQTLSIATGAESIYAPLGSTSNKGLELELNGTPVKGNDFQWDASLNFTMVKNKLVEAGGETGTIQAAGVGQYRPSVGPYSNGAFVASQVGLPLYQIYAYDYKYDDAGNIYTQNGIPVRSTTPKAMGSGIPKYYGGLNNNFRYKNFSLGVLVDYRFGVKVLSGTNYLAMYYGLHKNTLPGRETGVLAKGTDETSGLPNSTVVSAESYYKGLANITTNTVYDGSFIKLRQITFGYSINSDALKSAIFESINVSLVARNPLILMKHTPNIDPEDSYSPLPGNAGLQSIGVPPTRTFGVNVDFKFKN